ncbi:MAG: hypothetical protein M3O50_01905 [Myxococcota bacterium]|nr:hypothetical protein [Myxococcota bacterium]
MSDRTTGELKAEMKKTLGLLQTLRDETKVKVHLAGMDIKTSWDELQPKIVEAEQAAQRAAESLSEATLETIKTTLKKLQKLAESL